MSTPITNASPAQQTGVAAWSSVTAGDAKESKARALAAALWEQSQRSPADKLAVDKFVLDLQVLLTG